MKLKSKAFGEVEVSEKQRIHFKNGILGFEELHYFFLLDGSDEGSPFYWLQSEKISEIAFVVIDPRLILNDYQLDVDPKDLEKITIGKDDEVLVFSIVTLYDNPEDMTVNLLGPIVINKKSREAMQVINQINDYSVKHPLLDKRSAEC